MTDGIKVVPLGRAEPDVEARVKDLALAIRGRLQAEAERALEVAASLRELRECVAWLRELHATLGGTAGQLEAIAASLAAEADGADQKLTRREPILERVNEDQARRVRKAIASGQGMVELRGPDA